MALNTNYSIGKAFKAIENELIASMMRNLEYHKEWEDAEGFNWDAWQAVQLKHLEEYRLNNPKIFGKKFENINNDIKKLITFAKKQGGADAEADLLQNIGKKPSRIKAKNALVGDFFAVNDRKLGALINATTNDFSNAEYAVLRKANDEYRKIIYNAQVYANTGAGTYQKAVDMATKDFLSAGIQCIQYKNGSMHTIADYADMAIKTAQKRAYMIGEGEKRQEWGEHLVIVNRRTDACAKCAIFAGQVFIDDVYSGGTKSDGNYPLLSEAISAGLYHPRCKDNHTTYFPHVSTNPTKWKKAELEKLEENERKEEKKKYANMMAEKYKTLAKYSQDPDNIKKYQRREAHWRNYLSILENGRNIKVEQVSSIIPPIKRPSIRQLPKIEKTAKIFGLTQLNAGSVNASGNMLVLSKGTKILNEDMSKRTKMYFGSKNFMLTKGDHFVWHKESEIKNRRNQFKDIIEAIEKEKGVKYYGYEWTTRNGNGWLIDYFTDGTNWYAGLGGYTLFGAEIETEISKESIKKLAKIAREREEIIGKELAKKHIRYRTVKQRAGDDWVESMKVFHDAVKANDLPSIVPDDLYDNLNTPTLYRGIAPQSHLRKDITVTQTIEEMADSFYIDAQAFPSRGIYGDGIAYASPDLKGIAISYATGNFSNYGGKIIEYKLKEDAKIIKYADAVALFEEIADEFNDSQLLFNRAQSKSRHEVGKAMNALGYDCIIEPNGDYTGVPFYVILNRDALVAKEKWVTATTTREYVAKMRRR